ncbi:MAG TPA: VOC family protein [Caulobacteraceae bacterium]|jgi:catechol 2,3-dioxygenase-like lactoylglutathione lyase family enzyme|nr:VOC family protein [Caulobacteraceae bacterium]
MIDINGIAHVQLSVSDFGASRDFYRWLLHEMFGMTVQYDSERSFYCIGGRTGVLITPADSDLSADGFNQRRVGLHHFCFRLRSAADVDALHAALQARGGVNIVHAPRQDAWAPGYYSILFEDPDGIRLEANFVPGRGNLDVIGDGPPLDARDFGR